MISDRASQERARRIRAIFDQPGMTWIVDRLALRMQRGRPLTGTLSLGRASPDQRRALDDFLGRRSTVGAQLTLDLGTLLSRLGEAAGVEVLDEIVTACRRDIRNLREEAARKDHAWRAVHAELQSVFRENPTLSTWLNRLFEDGSLKRLVKGDAHAARELMATASRIVLGFPYDGVLLATLGAEVTGDSHALDLGQPLASLCLRAIHSLRGIDGQAGAAARRNAWEAVGVLVDDLSAPVLFYNLRAAANASIAALLLHLSERREPGYLTVRQLRSENPFHPLPPAMDVVHVCENPSVVSEVSRTLGAECAPIVCTNGQPTSSVRHLLGHLRDAGAAFRVHADFDAAGLRIVDLLLRDYGGTAWRMDAAAYLSATGVVRLPGEIPPTPWAPGLADAMRRRGLAIFEEQVVGTLIADLAMRL